MAMLSLTIEACVCISKHILTSSIVGGLCLLSILSTGTYQIHFVITKNLETSTDTQNNNTKIDVPEEIIEIKNYVDGRFICPQEAALRSFDFPIHHRNPAVQVLAVHLEGMQNVTFKDTQQLHNVVSNPGFGKTNFTEWLKNNTYDTRGRDLLYIYYLSEYRWDLSSKAWILRTSNKTPRIGRLAYVHPTYGELFYLRMLLGCKLGCHSFSEIRTVSNVVLPTYHAEREKLGLIGDDRKWSTTITEASTWATSTELRSIFAHMLLFVMCPTRSLCGKNIGQSLAMMCF
jgi:hypothetical protein